MIKINEVKFHPKSWLCPKGYAGITLFGHVFSSYDDNKILNTYYGKIFVNHENIHVIQAHSFLKTRWLGFYIYYIAYWLKNLFTVGFNHQAYREIPFEKEAYANELNFDYKQSYWKNYR